jgi:hypothetical protein
LNSLGGGKLRFSSSRTSIALSAMTEPPRDDRGFEKRPNSI